MEKNLAGNRFALIGFFVAALGDFFFCAHVCNLQLLGHFHGLEMRDLARMFPGSDVSGVVDGILEGETAPGWSKSLTWVLYPKLTQIPASASGLCQH